MRIDIEMNIFFNKLKVLQYKLLNFYRVFFQIRWISRITISEQLKIGKI